MTRRLNTTWSSNTTLALLFDMAGVLELCGSAPGVICKTIVVDALHGKWDITFFKEFLPANSFRPLTNTLIFLGVSCIGFKDLLDSLNSFRPAWE